MNMFKGLITGNATAIPDTMKLVVIGGTVETARRMTSTVWNGFVDSFFLNAHFSSEDYPYDWLLYWLSKQPAWGRSREFEITTRSRNGRWSQPTTGDLEEEEDEADELVHGRRRRKVAFMPSIDTTHTIFFKGHWLRITRQRRQCDYGYCSELRVSVVARNNTVIKQLVMEAKREYEKDAEHRVHIFLADVHGSWRWTGAKQKRPLSSIVLEPSVKQMLLNDCRDFLRSEEWYSERGIPYRRGYLLHGVPGSGKTSLIHSLAGELGLDIYVVSLSSKGMSDNTLTTLMGNVPSRCILLLEDLDAAFTRGVSRDSSSTGTPTGSTSSTSNNASSNSADDGSTLSLSGLLNALDGVAAAEGRLLFATTNHIERLDPALSRPGRCDVWVNFANASKWQAEGLFKCFFPSTKKESTNVDESSCDDKSSKPISERNIPELPKRKKKSYDIIQLSEEEIEALAKRFAERVPDNEFSVASIQGFLLQNKTRPRECVEEVTAWVEKERTTKAKLQKEKEEKEAKEKKEAEEKAANEKKAEGAKKAETKAEAKTESSSPTDAKDTSSADSNANASKSSPSESAATSSATPSDAAKTNANVDPEVESSLSSPVTSSSSADDTNANSQKWVAVQNADAQPQATAVAA